MVIFPLKAWPDRKWRFGLKFIMGARRRKGTGYAGADEREHLGGGFPQRRDAIRGGQPKPWHHGAEILGNNGSLLLF